MNLVLAFLDVCNISAVYFIGFIFSLRFFCLFQWVIWPIPVYVFLFILNIYACHRVIHAKRYIVDRILELFDAENEDVIDSGSQRRRHLLEYRLQTETQLPECAEFAYGTLGRIIIEISLAFLQWSMVVFHFQIISYSMNLLIANFNETMPFGTTTFEEIDGFKSDVIRTWTIIIGAIVVFVSLSLMRTARQCGPFSVLSLLCFNFVLGFIFYVIASGSYKTINLPTAFDNITDLDSFSKVYLHNHRLLFTQVVGGILTVECSMVGTRHLATYPILFCGTFVCVVGCCFIYGFGAPFNIPVRQILLQLNTSSVVNILVIVGIVCAFPLQNSPIYGVFEKRVLSKTACSSEYSDEEMVQLNLERYFEVDIPFFSAIRNNQLDVLHKNDIAADLETHAPWTLRYCLRTLVVVSQMLAAYLFWTYDIAFKIFCVMCLLASRFLAYIFPVATHLRIKWYQLSWFERFFDMTIIVICLTEAVQAFTYFVVFDWHV